MQWPHLQVVDRHMGWPRLHSLLQRVLPAGQRQVGEARDDVQAPAGNAAGVHGLDRRVHVLQVVRAAARPEQGLWWSRRVRGWGLIGKSRACEQGLWWGWRARGWGFEWEGQGREG